jgi:glycosyltransferase involved in cell wall biosynthesis
MRVLFVYEYDARSMNVQSGRPHGIRDAFKRRGHEVVDLFPLERRIGISFLIRKAVARFREELYAGERSLSYLLSMKRRIEAEIDRVAPDLVFSPSSIPLTLVAKGSCRMYCADATFECLCQSYERLRNCSERYKEEAHFQEWVALRTAHCAIYPSEWAAASALGYYDADPKTVRVIPFGATLPAGVTRPQIAEAISGRLREPIRFVFIGREKVRKGLGDAIALVDLLNDENVKSVVEVVGLDGASSDRVKFHGFLDKEIESHAIAFDRLMREADFVLIPSRAEAFSRSLLEALGYGVPIIAYGADGVRSILRDGENGLILREPLASNIGGIRELIADRMKYVRMCDQARQDFEARFNWEVFIEAVEAIVADRSR